MMELTWLGWLFTAFMILGILISLFRGVTDTWDKTSPGEATLRAFTGTLWLVGFFTVGFVK